MTDRTAGPNDDEGIGRAGYGKGDAISDAFALMADLGALVQAGWLVEVREPGRPSRYGLSKRARGLAADAHEHDLAPSEESLAYSRDLGSEPCPNCGSPAGYDAGARCRDCRVAFLPEGA